MVLLIPDAVRKIKAQGRAEGYPQGRAEGYPQGRAEGYAQGRAEGYAQGRAEGYAQGRQEARQRIRAALLEYRRRKGMGLRDPIPVSEIRKVIDDIDFNDTARSI